MLDHWPLRLSPRTSLAMSGAGLALGVGLTALSPAIVQASFDVVFDRQIPAVGVPQEDQAHHRHEVFVAGVVRIGSQGVGRVPEALQAFFYSTIAIVLKCQGGLK
jgi:hypothetical protein